MSLNRCFANLRSGQGIRHELLVGRDGIQSLYSFVLSLSFSCCRELVQSGEMNSSTALDASRISDLTSLVRSLENSLRNSTMSPAETESLFMSSALEDWNL